MLSFDARCLFVTGATLLRLPPVEAWSVSSIESGSTNCVGEPDYNQPPQWILTMLLLLTKLGWCKPTFLLANVVGFPLPNLRLQMLKFGCQTTYFQVCWGCCCRPPEKMPKGSPCLFSILVLYLMLCYCWLSYIIFLLFWFLSVFLSCFF